MLEKWTNEGNGKLKGTIEGESLGSFIRLFGKLIREEFFPPFFM